MSIFSVSESREDIFTCKTVDIFLYIPWKSSLHSHLVYYISHLCRKEAKCFGTVSLPKESQTGLVTCCYFIIQNQKRRPGSLLIQSQWKSSFIAVSCPAWTPPVSPAPSPPFFCLLLLDLSTFQMAGSHAALLPV